MKTIIALAAIVCGLATHTAQAIEAPTRVGVHMVTAHSASGFCNVNPGAYAVWSNGFTAGAYRNSECKRISAYSGWTWETEGRLRAGLTAGVVTGYQRAPLLPLLVPSVAYSVTPATAVRLTFLPKIEKRGASALHLSLEFTL